MKYGSSVAQVLRVIRLDDLIDVFLPRGMLLSNKDPWRLNELMLIGFVAWT